jgi:crossover junction endodeoxyribonuclease RusA
MTDQTLHITVTAPAGAPPKPKGSLRHVGKGKLVEQVAGSKTWRAVIALAARQAINTSDWTIADGPVRVQAIVDLPRPKTNRDPLPIRRSSGDSDKHARNILDALSDGGVYVDDSQVTDLRIIKRFADGIQPGAVINVTKLEA